MVDLNLSSKKLSFEKGKLATNARPRGKAPGVVGIGMSVRNCLAEQQSCFNNVQSIFNPIIQMKGLHKLPLTCIISILLNASGENRSGLKHSGSPNSPPQYLDSLWTLTSAQLLWILRWFSTKQGCTLQYLEELLKTVISYHLTLSSVFHSASNLKQIPLLR